MPRPPASAIILAGGLASRLGGEKALRALRGRTLLQIALETAAPLCAQRIVACGNRDYELPKGVLSAPDDPSHAGCGPLAGIAAGLALAEHDLVLVLACDLPHVTPDLARALLDALDTADCAWCRHSADEPLLAALRRKPALAAVSAALAAGRNKVMPVWQSLKSLTLMGPALQAFGNPAWLFANVNTPDDLASA